MADVRSYSIHVVSDDGAMRCALEGALRDLRHAVAVFADADEYVRLGGERRADCLMLDQDLPLAAATQLQHWLRGAVVRVPVVGVAFAASTAKVVRAMRAGALDFLCVPFGRDDLARSIEAAAQASREWREEDERRSRVRDLLGRLSPRERAVSASVLEGRRNKQIAACLGNQEATVKVHRSRLMRKLEVRLAGRTDPLGPGARQCVLARAAFPRLRGGDAPRHLRGAVSGGRRGGGAEQSGVPRTGRLSVAPARSESRRSIRREETHMNRTVRRSVIEATRRSIPFAAGVVIGTMVTALFWSFVP